jgi:very-short-patch-repair endonuclease
MTGPEVVLWCKLKGRQMSGAKFRRQYSIGPYVLDFYCPKLKLAVEVDGDSHYSDEGIAHDERRQAYLEQFDVRVLRFTNVDVLRNIKGVLEVIWGSVEEAVAKER